MKIQSENNSVSFQKKLIAQTMLKQNNQPISVDIFELEYPKDTCYFNQKIDYDKDWDFTPYADAIKYQFMTFGKYNNHKYYSIENNGKSIGIVETIDSENLKDKDIKFLQVCPKYASNKNRNRNREIQFIGQTIVAFLAKLAKEDKSINALTVKAFDINAKDFYKKCGFIHKSDTGFILEKENLDKAIKNQEEKTGTLIRMV